MFELCGLRSQLCVEEEEKPEVRATLHSSSKIADGTRADSIAGSKETSSGNVSTQEPTHGIKDDVTLQGPTTASASRDMTCIETPTTIMTVDSWEPSGEGHSIGLSPQMWWDPSRHGPIASMPAMYGFEHLNDLEDIFAFTGSTVPPEPAANLDIAYGQQVSNIVAQASPSNIFYDRVINVSSADTFGLPPADEEYLRSQGCFQLPPTQVFREMMLLYFRIVHPNLPVVIENEFWALWTGGAFRLGNFPLLVVRAMIYTTCTLIAEETLSLLGFNSKRDATEHHYRLAKLLFDFGTERDAASNAQACLLLTYQTPSDNKFRVNSSWLTHATRFARIAKADSYHRFREEEPARSKLLKRLWWGILFRDRIISLGVRRSLEVEFDPSWESCDGQQVLQEHHLLQADDFSTELGQSPVHGLETQLRIVEMVNSTCRLVHCLSRPLKVLYNHEGLEDRLDAASRSLRSTILDIQKSISLLRTWHDETITKFPFPVSLGDSDEGHEAICVYANMMFCYSAAAIFALNTYLLLIYEMITASRPFFEEDLVEECEEALEVSNTDIARRIQELVQVRLVKYLPISVNPIIGPPLALQAINVAASRGTRLEAVERRKLDVFTRTLQSLHERFNGTAFFAELMHNIIGFASDDEALTRSMTDWRKNGSCKSAPARPGQIKVGWNNLVHQKPRLFLRLMMHLDHAVCTGGPPQEKDFPAELRRDTM